MDSAGAQRSGPVCNVCDWPGLTMRVCSYHGQNDCSALLYPDSHDNMGKCLQIELMALSRAGSLCCCPAAHVHQPQEANKANGRLSVGRMGNGGR